MLRRVNMCIVVFGTSITHMRVDFKPSLECVNEFLGVLINMYLCIHTVGVVWVCNLCWFRCGSCSHVVRGAVVISATLRTRFITIIGHPYLVFKTFLITCPTFTLLIIPRVLTLSYNDNIQKVQSTINFNIQ